MNTQYAVTQLMVSIHPVNTNPLLGSHVTLVSLQDEGGGPYIRIEQHCNDREGITLEWPEIEAVRSAAQELLESYQQNYSGNLE